MQKVHNKTELQRAISIYIISQFETKNEEEEMRQVFFELNTEKNGKLSKQELLEGYKKHIGDYQQAEH